VWVPEAASFPPDQPRVDAIQSATVVWDASGGVHPDAAANGALPAPAASAAEILVCRVQVDRGPDERRRWVKALELCTQVAARFAA